MYEVNNRLWNFGRPRPSVASLFVANTEKICKRSRCSGAAAQSARVLLRLMLNYDMYFPVIYLSSPLDQWTMICLHWCQPICLGCMVWCVLVVSLLFWWFKSTICKFRIWPTYSTPNQSYVRYNPLQWFQHCNFRTDYLFWSFFFASFNIPMRTTYGMDTCIETNEIIAFGMKVYSRYIYTWHM